MKGERHEGACFGVIPRTLVGLISIAALGLPVRADPGTTSPPAGAGRHAHGPAASLDATEEAGIVHVLHAGRGGESPEAIGLYHVRSSDAGVSWSAPVRVDAGIAAVAPPQRGRDARIFAARGVLAVAWTTPGTGFGGSGPLATAFSRDGGATWTSGGNPADDGSTAGHGFAAFAAWGDTLHLVWLDGRDGRQGLRHAARPLAGGPWSANRTLDDATCECCANELRAGPDGALYAFYRDRNPRDMALAVSRDGVEWRAGETVGVFGWEFQGCPHVGGDLAFSASGALAAVWTGREGEVGVHLYRRAADASSWSGAGRIGNRTAKHPRIAAGRGRVAVVWNEIEADRTTVWGVHSADDGGTWSRPARLSPPGTDAVQPRVVRVEGGFVVLWSGAAADGVAGWNSLHWPDETPHR